MPRRPKKGSKLEQIHHLCHNNPQEVNHTFVAPQQQYYPIYPSLNSTQIHPSTLTAAYYPNVLPAWRPSTQQQQGLTSNRWADANLTYLNSRSPHITFIEANQPSQVHNRQLEALPPPPPTQLATPKNEPNPENQLNPHTPLPTIGMILPIAGGSSMEFQTKKQKKYHLRLINSIAVQGPVRYTDWSKMPITFLEQDLQLESYPHTDTMVIKANIADGKSIGFSYIFWQHCQ